MRKVVGRALGYRMKRPVFLHEGRGGGGWKESQCSRITECRVSITCRHLIEMRAASPGFSSPG